MHMRRATVEPKIDACHDGAVVSLALVALGVALLGGCGAPSGPGPSASSRSMTARYTAEPIDIDGVLNERVWRRATVYRLSLSEDRLAKGDRLREGGEVRLAWDKNHFYAGIEFHDSDIVAGYDVDQVHHYNKGDLVELFLKPQRQSWYWELYATPRGNKTSFWLPKSGTLTVRQCGLRVAARCRGTLNNSNDKDHSWSAEMAMPLKDLATRIQPFAPGTQWQILVSRYNHDATLKSPEFSMVPRLSRSNFHLTNEFGFLKLEGGPPRALSSLLPVPAAAEQP